MSKVKRVKRIHTVKRTHNKGSHRVKRIHNKRSHRVKRMQALSASLGKAKRVQVLLAAMDSTVKVGDKANHTDAALEQKSFLL